MRAEAPQRRDEKSGTWKPVGGRLSCVRRYFPRTLSEQAIRGRDRQSVQGRCCPAKGDRPGLAAGVKCRWDRPQDFEDASIGQPGDPPFRLFQGERSIRPLSRVLCRLRPSTYGCVCRQLAAPYPVKLGLSSAARPRTDGRGRSGHSGSILTHSAINAVSWECDTPFVSRVQHLCVASCTSRPRPDEG